MIRRPPSSTLCPYRRRCRSSAKSTLLKQKEVPGGYDPTRYQVEQVYAMVARRIVSARQDWKSTRLNSSHQIISYAVFCLKKKKNKNNKTKQVTLSRI